MSCRYKPLQYPSPWRSTGEQAQTVCAPQWPYLPTKKDSERRRYARTHCNTLQHTATHCNTLQHTATHCNTLQQTATSNDCAICPQTRRQNVSGTPAHTLHRDTHVNRPRLPRRPYTCVNTSGLACEVVRVLQCVAVCCSVLQYMCEYV